METNGIRLPSVTTNNTTRIKVLVVQIDNQHLFVHDVTNKPCAANAIERRSNFYRRQKRFAKSHFCFDVLGVTALPAREEVM
jgi:hypothetical protein